jgi:hypothetical protein
MPKTQTPPPSQSQSRLLRLVAFTSGSGILASSTWTLIDAGNLQGSAASLAVALSVGVAAASMALPKIRSKALIAGLSLALFCGEASSLLSVAERVVIQRQDLASTADKANSTSSRTQERLTRLEAELTAHRASAAATVATKDCRIECRLLLERQTSSLETAVVSAKHEAATAPAQRSASPLADRLGIKPWILDVMAAILLSVGSTALSAFLIAWASSSAEPTAAEALDRTTGNLPVNTDVPRVPHTPFAGPVTGQVSETTRGVLKLISASGGTLSDSQRQMAKDLGLSTTKLSRALQEAKAAGLIECCSDKATGTRVRVLA